jgi:hypothetical protein
LWLRILNDKTTIAAETPGILVKEASAVDVRVEEVEISRLITSLLIT